MFQSYPNQSQQLFSSSLDNLPKGFLEVQDGQVAFVRHILPLLCEPDKASLRSTCTLLRQLVNRSVHALKLDNPAHFYNFCSWNLLQRFPQLATMEFSFNSAQEAKAATMYVLTQPPNSLKQVQGMRLSEGKSIQAQQYAQQQQYNESRYGYNQHESSRYQAYGYQGSKPVPITLDFTEVLLASVCSCFGLGNLHIEKAVLLETEAAAIARLPKLTHLHLSTNTTAQPLRRPLVQLMLASLTQLQELHLSYIRDTTADLATSLPALTALTRLGLEYAYFGESGAGEKVMAALAKHQVNLLELKLYECCVNDEMLASICACTTLTSLHVQDEDAPEESCPTNSGLAAITQLQSLRRLELFGEELRLDAELLGRLAQLPALQHLAMAGLDALHPGGAGGAGGVSDDDADADVEEMEMSSAGDGDQDVDDDASSGASMDDVTSRPRPPPHQPSHWEQPRQDQLGSSSGHYSPPTMPMASFAVQQPLQALPTLSSLTLYGPMSVRVFPPPLALLLPQPGLLKLKLSACASHANLRALAHQTGLTKLTLSHSAVKDLYPDGAAAGCSGGGEMDTDETGAVSSGAPSVPSSILGYGPEVGLLQHLAILRLKDLPGFGDLHLAHLVVALEALPNFSELKLRSLPQVSDAGLAVLPRLRRLQRIKLYDLGEGVTDEAVTGLSASMPALAEIKVKGCARVAVPYPREAALARRTATLGAAVTPLVLRFGLAECSGSSGSSK